MKKTIFIIIATIGYISVANAQTFRPFKINLGMGEAAVAAGSDAGGFLLTGEPTYSIQDNISVGIKLEQTFGSMKWINSELLAGDYYFSNKYTFRPYAGGGIGYYYTALNGGGCDAGPTVAMSSIKSSAHKIGTMARAGFEAQHFCFSIEYDFVPTTYVTYINTESGTPTTMATNYSNSYLGLSFGIYVGGGKKDK